MPEWGWDAGGDLVARALHAMGALQQIRYICSTSGSGWLTGPLCFGSHHASLETFLGPMVQPGDLTIPKLEQVRYGSFGGLLSG